MPSREARVLLLQHLALLLAHGFAQNVGSGQRVPGDLLRDAHDLLLVDDQAVGLGQDLPSGSSSSGWIGLTA